MGLATFASVRLLWDERNRMAGSCNSIADLFDRYWQIGRAKPARIESPTLVVQAFIYEQLLPDLF